MPARNGSAGLFLGAPRTAHYRPSVYTYAANFWMQGQRGFRVSDVEIMRRDPRINFGLSVIAAPLFRVTWEVTSPHEEVAQFVDRQLKRFWMRDLIHVLKLPAWGFCPAEVVYEQKGDLIEYERLKDLYPLDCRPRERGGQLSSFRVGGAHGINWEAAPPITAPRMFWATHEPEYGSFYGRSRLEGAWLPWIEKTGKHGALDVRRLWFLKNAFRGGTIRHPSGTIELGNGQVMANEDYAREVLEKYETGGILVLPNAFDTETGKFVWEWEPPAPNGEPPGILDYPQALSEEEMEGMNISPEVVKASEAGSGWSGRAIPFIVFLTGEDLLARQIVDPFDRQVLRPLVWVNYGSDKDYEIELHSLVEMAQKADQQGQGGQDGQGQGAQPQPGQPGPGGTQPYQGPRGGQGVRDPATGKVRYGLSLEPEVIQEPTPITLSLDTIKAAVREVLAEQPIHLASNWAPYTGPHGGKGWKHTATGEVLYQRERPGGDDQPEKPREQAARALRDATVASAQAATEALAKVAEVGSRLTASVSEPVKVRLAALTELVPESVRAPLSNVWHAVHGLLFSVNRGAQALAAETGRQKGLSEEQTQQLSQTLAAWDLRGQITAYAAAGAALTIPGAQLLAVPAKAMTYVPVGSISYLLYSTAQNPLNVAKAAGRLLRERFPDTVKGAAAFAWGAVRHPLTPAAHGHEPVRLALEENDEREQLAATLADRLAQHGDWYQALAAVATDETGDPGQALEMADVVTAEHAAPPGEPTQLSQGPFVSEELRERVREIAERRYSRSIRLGQDLADDDVKALADLYAAHWNLLAEAGLPVPEDELERVGEELGQTDWLLRHDAKTGRWEVVHGDRLHLSLWLAVTRAPKGGVSIAGKHFRGGQFIPAKDLAKATPEERAQIDAAGDPTRDRLKAKGSVNPNALKGQLAEHAGDLGKAEQTAAKRSYNALKNHYGDLAVHRIEELARDTQQALAQIGDEHPNADGLRAQFSGRLRGYHHMLGLAEADGLHGQVATADAAAATGRHAERQRVQAEQKQAAARTSLPKNPAPGQVYNAKTDELQVDPERFQFKLNTEKGTGVTQELKQVAHWNPDFAGVVSVWRDPADGKTYVVNGHHRRELAGRLGVPDMAIRYIEAKDATEARAKGALINIAEGRGTAVDAAKFMRDTGVTVDDLGKHGVSLKGKLAANASTMTGLSDRLFNKLALGTLEEDRALAIAEHLKDHDLQNQLFARIEQREDDTGKGLTPRIVAEMAREMALTPTASANKGGLFGDLDDTKESLIIERAELKDDLRRDLASNASAYAAVASERRAKKVEGAGNVLNVEENKRRADEAERVKNTFDAVLKYKGPANDAINEAAQELRNAKGKRERDGIKERLRERLRGILAHEMDAGTEKPGTPGRGEGSPSEPGVPDAAGTAGAAVSYTGGRRAEPAGLAESAAALQSLPVGELHTVAGFKVRRTGPDEYRIETQTGTGNVRGDAAKILDHIQRQQTSDRMYGRLRTEALARAAAHAEPSFLEADRLEAATKAFQSLPEGTPVVSLEEGTHGRAGKIVKDEQGRTRVKLDGEDGYASNFVEPLEAQHSWRSPEGQQTKTPKPAAPDLFAAEATAPAATAAPPATPSAAPAASGYPQTPDRAERDALARRHGVHDVPRADVDALVAAVRKHGPNNLASLVDVRKELGWDRQRADKAIHRARIEQAISLAAWEGRLQVSDAQRKANQEASIQEEPGVHLLHAMVRPEWR